MRSPRSAVHRTTPSAVTRATLPESDATTRSPSFVIAGAASIAPCASYSADPFAVAGPVYAERFLRARSPRNVLLDPDGAEGSSAGSGASTNAAADTAPSGSTWPVGAGAIGAASRGALHRFHAPAVAASDAASRAAKI